MSMIFDVDSIPSKKHWAIVINKYDSDRRIDGITYYAYDSADEWHQEITRLVHAKQSFKAMLVTPANVNISFTIDI